MSVFREGPGRALVASVARPHLYLLAGDLRGAGGPGWGVQVTRAGYVLEQVDQQGTGVGTAMHMHNIVGAAQLEQWLALWAVGHGVGTGATTSQAPYHRAISSVSHTEGRRARGSPLVCLVS